MNNLIILPIIIPFIIGAILLITAKHYRFQRILSGIVILIMLVISIYITIIVYKEGIMIVEAGGWSVTDGIVLVADMLSTLIVIRISILSVACLFFVFKSIASKREQFYFYSFYFFLLAGSNGAFLTLDVFNLFVFCEVTLIASYSLIVNGGTKLQILESFKYMIINMFASALFVLVVPWFYSVTGSIILSYLSI